MIEKEILILTGPKHSGKTSKLLEEIKSRSDVCGILTPVENGVRFFLDVSANEKFRMEATLGKENVMHVGKYSFSVDAFERAKNLLREGMKKKNCWVIIDEVGPLELKKLGFYPVINEMLGADLPLKIVMVIRDSILEEVIRFFGLEKFSAFQVKTAINFYLP